MHIPPFRTRRDFLKLAGSGFGMLAFNALAAADAAKAVNPLAVKKPHFEPKAKSVIFLFMEGGPSHLDICDHKPELNKQSGKPLPASFGKVLTAMGTGGNNLLGSPRTWKKYGQSGLEFSNWIPKMAEHADDWCVLRGCQADGINHVGSVCQMNTGSILHGKPSLGAWALYGLGSVNQNMPGFVVMTDGGEPFGGARNWGTGYMDATYQGTQMRPGDNPILNLKTPVGVPDDRQRAKIALINELNELHRAAGRKDDSELAARQEAYELAFRMQATAPEAVDLSKETEATKEMYGLNRKETAEFGRQCLLARRLVERGVRFVQLYCGAGSAWDSHSDMEGNHSKMCLRADGPTAALMTDLKQRGMLKDTLVIWGGEFGRTPMTEGKDGRDHNPYGFSMMMAGGGVKGGMTYGATDEFGLNAVDGKCHVHDFHATILHLLGFDHEKLTYRTHGRDDRLTDVSGKVAKGILV